MTEVLVSFAVREYLNLHLALAPIVAFLGQFVVHISVIETHIQRDTSSCAHINIRGGSICHNSRV